MKVNKRKGLEIWLGGQEAEVGPSMDVFVLISMLGTQIWRRYLTFSHLLAGC